MESEICKVEKAQAIDILNKIDAELNTQRIYLRIIKNNKWIDERKFRIAMEQIYEIGKGYRKEIIEFNLKQEEYIMWLLEQLKTQKYKHGGYTVFYVTEPKVRKIEKSRYIDRIVHRYTSQMFANIYLNEVDQFVKNQLHISLTLIHNFFSYLL